MELVKISITDFNAFSSEEVLQTDAIQNSIDACFLRGGGVVVVPKGIYRIGGIRLRTNVTLYLESGAVLLGSRNPEDYFSYLEDRIEPLQECDLTLYPTQGTVKAKTLMSEEHPELDYYKDYYRKAGRRWNNALIRAIRAENIAIIGEQGSIIDGANCYDDQGEEGYRGPHGIAMHDCRNVRFEGYTMRHSANWGHHIVRTQNITCRNLTLEGGHDGVHFTQCHNIDVRDSEFYTGDDCIAGFANVNVTVSNCKTNCSCNGFRFSGTNVVIQNCHIFGPGKYSHRYVLTEEEKKSGAVAWGDGKDNRRSNMVSAFTYYADYSFPIEERPENIIIKDCVIENTDRFLHYNYSGNERWQINRPLWGCKRSGNSYHEKY